MKNGTRILLLNNDDSNSGPGIASYRLHKALRQIGLNSRMFVQNKLYSDDTIQTPQLLSRYIKMAELRAVIDGVPSPAMVFFDHLPLLRYSRKNREWTYWSTGWMPNLTARTINKINPDIVHLHWICNGFLPVSGLKKIKQPLIWTLHDMWAFTGDVILHGNVIIIHVIVGSVPN
jgi:hypothetical protein